MTFEEWWAQQEGCKEITKYEAAKNAWYAAKFITVREQISEVPPGTAWAKAKKEKGECDET